MTAVTLPEAWSKWREGQLPPETVLWGFKLFWWARIGKLLECFAGATILADIIGSEKLRSYGNALHGTITLATALALIKDAVLWYWRFLVAGVLLVLRRDKDDEALDRAARYRTDKIHVVFSIIVAGGLFYWQIEGGDTWKVALVGTFFAGSFFYTAGSIVTVAGIFVSQVFLLLVDTVVFEPVAWVLGRPDIERWIKITSLLMLLVGFHFDFLTA